MRSEDLLKYIGGVDDEFVDEVMNDKVVTMSEGREKRRRWLTAAACLAVIIICAAVLMGTGMSIDRGQMTLSGSVADIPLAQNSVVMLDVNPSLQFEVNDRNVVVSAEACNADAEAIMDELKLEGMSCDEAVKTVMAVLQEHAYITNLKNSVLVTVVNSDKSEAELIRTAVVDAIGLFDESTSYDLSILSQIFTDISEYAEIAENYNMSEGRAALIQKTCELFEDCDFESLAECSIHAINQLFEYIEVPDFIQRIGSAAATVPDELKEQLKLDGLTADELISFVSAISDFYDRLCEYYEEQDVANHIGYVFNIVCDSNSGATKRWAVLAESLGNELESFCAIINIGEKTIGDWCSGSTFREIVAYIDSIT